MVVGVLNDSLTNVLVEVIMRALSGTRVDVLTEANANVLTAMITVEITMPAFSCWPIVVLGYTHALQA